MVFILALAFVHLNMKTLTGFFKAADGTKTQGVPYGQPYGSGSNVTAIRHSRTSLEFLLDGKSVGLLTLKPEDALPADAVPCAGGCHGAKNAIFFGVFPMFIPSLSWQNNRFYKMYKLLKNGVFRAGVRMGVVSGAAPPGPPKPPPPPPPPPAGRAVLAECNASAPEQQWSVDPMKGTATQADGRLGLQFPNAPAGGFGEVTVTASPGKEPRLLRHFVHRMIILPRQARDKHRENSKQNGVSASGPVWWSADEGMGYLHGDSNHPMLCNCMAVCGGEA